MNSLEKCLGVKLCCLFGCSLECSQIYELESAMGERWERLVDDGGGGGDF